MTQPKLLKQNNISLETENSKLSSHSEKVFWFILIICAVLTILFASATALLAQLPNGFVYMTSEHEIHLETLDSINWDYSGIWGGILMMILTLAIVPREKSSSSVCTSVSRFCLLLTSCMVAGVAIVRAVVAAHSTSHIFWKYDYEQKNYDYHPLTLKEDHSRTLIVMLACMVGTAIFATMNCSLIFVYVVGSAFKYALDKCRDTLICCQNRPSESASNQSAAEKSVGDWRITMNNPPPFVCKLGEIWCYYGKGTAQDVEVCGCAELKVDTLDNTPILKYSRQSEANSLSDMNAN